MGLAIGSRITSAVLIVPFLYLILAENNKIKTAIYFSVISCAVASALFYLYI